MKTWKQWLSNWHKPCLVYFARTICLAELNQIWASTVNTASIKLLKVWRIRQVCSFLLLRRASPKIIAILHGNQRSPQSLIDRGREPSNCPFATIHNAVDSEFPSNLRNEDGANYWPWIRAAVFLLLITRCLLQNSSERTFYLPCHFGCANFC